MSYRLLAGVLVAALFAPAHSTLRAQPHEARTDTVTKRYYFHRPGIDYGSASIRGPLGTFMDRGFSVMVFDKDQGDLNAINWKAGWAAVSDAMLHPQAAIERSGGWTVFLKKEFFPESADVWRWAWAPNYGGHMLAGGITHRYLTEWFQDRHIPYPKVTATAWYMAMMVTNEVLENEQGKPGKSSTVADLGIFDPLGLILFSSDHVANFFANTLQAADWSPQASIAFPRARLVNSSQIMSYKVPVPIIKPVRMIFLLGQGAGTGITFPLHPQFNLSGVVGFEARARHVDTTTGAESIDADYGGGLFLDRNNSLLVSVILSKRLNSRVAINMYPGILPGPMKPLGIWSSRMQNKEWSFGLAYRHTGGVGIGWNIVR